MTSSPGASNRPGRPGRRRVTPDPPEPLGVPSTLTAPPRGTAARTGRASIDGRVHKHQETSPALTAGDVDADWVAAYSVGDEAPGGDNPTPDQTAVDDYGQALGVAYRPEEELRGPEKIAERDRHRWELDPSSAEDLPERGRPEARPKKPRGGGTPGARG